MARDRRIGAAVFLLTVAMARHALAAEPAGAEGVWDQAPRIRIRTIEALARSPGTDDNVRWLLLATTDPDRNVRAAAIAALGQAQARSAAPFLTELAGSDQPDSAAARRALDQIGPIDQDELLWLTSRHKFALVQGRHERLPDFDLRYLSSAQTTPFDEMKTLDELARNPDSGYRRQPGESPRQHRERLARQAVYRAQRLPNKKLGAFGLVDSEVVEEVRSDTDIVLRYRSGGVAGFGPRGTSSHPGKITYLRVLGVSTKYAITGEYWPGPDRERVWPGHDEKGGFEIAIVGTTKVGRRTMLLALPLDEIRRGLTREEFQDLVEQGVSLDARP